MENDVLQEEKQRKAQGRRGKFAEGKVQGFLEAVSQACSSFDWERKYDARSAGGRFPSQAGDFGFYRDAPEGTTHGLIEVKEVEHDFRLPAKNFPGIGKLRVREMAGGDILVLVCHLPQKLWRRVPFSFFTKRLDDTSWDLSDFSLWGSVEEALSGIAAFSVPAAKRGRK